MFNSGTDRQQLIAERQEVLSAKRMKLTESRLASMPNGIGKELALLYKQVGLYTTAGCGCEDVIKKINALGPKEIAKGRQEVIGWLEASQLPMGITVKEIVAAMLKLTASGIIPDPVKVLSKSPELLAGELLGAMLNEAVKRWEAKQSKK